MWEYLFVQHKAKKRFGQNFLTDEMTITRIIKAISVKENDCLIEIGPGLGALTVHLIRALKKLHVIEIDRDAIAYLRENIAPQEKLIIHEGDVLKFNFADIIDNGKIRIVGNLPYNISTPILFHLLDFRDHIVDIHVMLQKEMVERICAKPGNKVYGRLSVVLQYFYECDFMLTVPPQAFKPQPKVTSAILRLKPRTEIGEKVVDEDLFICVVRSAFSSRRKTLNNNLKQNFNMEKISAIGIDVGRRAETLSVNDFVRISNILSV